MYKAEMIDNLYECNEELGAIYSKDKTEFAVWAPMAEEVKVLLFKYYDSRNAIKTVDMKKEEKGLWHTFVYDDLNGIYYNYLVKNNGKIYEVVDPYAKAVSVNGTKGAIVDLLQTNPEEWNHDTSPKIDSICDSILYEMHIRDFSIDKSSGIDKKYRGKFAGACMEGTINPKTGSKTCLDHLKELGITTVHLLPVFDFCSVDESKYDENDYNWGYDPENYNAIEGSYSTNPFDPACRIKEFKQMVLNFHKAGIRVVMDVVYNHTYKSKDSNFNKIFPDYYYRQDSYGKFSNGSGCGNELATERSMVRKFIVDSILYYAKEYHIDGFRFDLMGLYDTETIIKIRKELDKIDKNIIMYGEGWTGGYSPLPQRMAAIKSNTLKYGDLQIAAFNDNIRDAIKGHVFDVQEKGFVNGQPGFEETLKFGIVGATYHKDINYEKVYSNKEPWANEPYQSITYESAHDNYTLWDKLKLSTLSDENELIKMNKLCAAIVLTAQGIPFLHSGEEFARTKKNSDDTLNENSYNSPDSVNKISWDRKDKYMDLFKYYRGLINLRRNHCAFRMNLNTQIQDNLKFIEFHKNNVVGFVINGKKAGDSWNKIIVIHNGRNENISFDLKDSKYNVVVDAEKAGTDILYALNSNIVKISAKSSLVVYK